eukprot:3793158-Alexandrium_andersonii.AAC.1
MALFKTAWTKTPPLFEPGLGHLPTVGAQPCCRHVLPGRVADISTAVPLGHKEAKEIEHEASHCN